MLAVLSSDAATGDVLRNKTSLLVVDEVHSIKSRTIARDLALSFPTPAKIGLTGTSITNCLTDMYQLLVWASKTQPFGTEDMFRQRYDIPIQKGHYKNSTQAERTVAENRLKMYQLRIQPFIHRRTFDEVLDNPMPPKTEFHLSLAITPVQLALYTQVLRRQQGTASTAPSDENRHST